MSVARANVIYHTCQPLAVSDRNKVEIHPNNCPKITNFFIKSVF